MRHLGKTCFGLTLVCALFLSTTPETSAMAGLGIKKQPFGKTSSSEPVDIYTLTNSKGVEARIITFGGAVVSLKIPDRTGKFADVVLGFDNLDGYLNNNRPFFGVIVGRYANRIGKGKFSLSGKEYTLPKNNGENTLHGGNKGFDKVVWKARELKSKDAVGVSLSHLSKNGDEGFPGNLSVRVLYTLTNNNEFRIDYSATTDQETVVNLTHHSYFNLGADDTILKHELMINADRFTPVDSGLIPTGDFRSVKDTPMDFTTPTAIGARIDQQDEQLGLGRGYDHNWVLNRTKAGLILAARAYEPGSGRVLEVLTTEPGMQLYTGNFLDGSITGKGGRVYIRRSGFCLETQHYPDSPNKPDFPSTVLKPGKRFASTTVYKFSVR